jgi:broad specificity phosphatase PhoE
MSRLITIIRHGETVYNADPFYLQTIDAPLTPFGLLQSSMLVGEYDYVFVSPLVRTLKTYNHSRIKTENLIVEPLVREYIAYPCDLLENEPIAYESDSELTERCKSFLNKIKKIDEEKKFCVITHSNWILKLAQITNNCLTSSPNNCQQLIFGID